MKKKTESNSPWYWIREPKGTKSVSATLVFFSFWITAASYALSCFDRIGPVTFRHFDSVACSSFLVPVLTLYFSRKFTVAKFGDGQQSNQSTSS